MEKKETQQQEQENIVNARLRPKDYEEVFETPDGVMTQHEYLAWLGDKVVRLEKAITG